MTTFFTRRTLLGVGATGILAALTACASDIRPLSQDSRSQGSGGSSGSPSATASGAASSASASASPSPTDDHTPGSYVGPIKFNNYERNGTYIAASANAPAQNVPKPLIPEKMKENSPEGAYALMGYWLASQNYLILTGDVEPLMKADPAKAFLKNSKTMIRLYESGLGWIYGSDQPYKIEIAENELQPVANKPDRYEWLVTVAYDPAAKYHIEGEPDATIVEEEKTIPRTTKFIMEYKEGMWRMLLNNNS
ncbi:DUF6318 family protein [Rothia mucilaginosa]|uniref:DUF6318 family protein n=1 Tax=Rothia mucilaginosa TaxID=43675 RepID=UPI00066B402A|nr:DUF6318 family protein [Rothia mucilaginosa]